MRTIGRCILVLLCCALVARGQGTVPARIIVTMGHYFGHEPPLLTASDLLITQNQQPLKITSLTPLRGAHAGLELYVVVDNCSSCEVGPKFEELSQFIVTQPSSTSVGVAYIQNGQLQVALEPTTDRVRTLKALSPPGGSEPASPYDALADLMKRWKPGSARRAVLMISTGLDPASRGPLLEDSKSADAALRAAERGEVTIYAIYHPTADYMKMDFGKIEAGQVELSHVAAGSGGEAYFLSPGPLPSLAPFLTDINQHLANQYQVDFLVNRQRPAEELEDVKVKSRMRLDLELMAPFKAVIAGESTKPGPGA